jgi:hypothetical protein
MDLNVTLKDTRLILNIIYVWKLNQTVLELDFRAVKFVFFPRRDLIYIYKESLPQVDGFHRVLRIPPPIKLTATT